MTLFLSRLEINRDPQMAALGGLLDPKSDQKLDAHHKLIWTAFAGDPAATRDFLWREERRGVFLVLSPRPPADSPVFGRMDVKEFAPDLRAGDQLAFSLRANATRTVKTGETTRGGKERKRHIDLVMDALPESGARAAARLTVAENVAQAWLARQGTRSGFQPEAVAVEDYAVRRFYRGAVVTFGVMDMQGTLTVTDPGAILPALARGFGRAKAFGCGLMLIRRA